MMIIIKNMKSSKNITVNKQKNIMNILQMVQYIYFLIIFLIIGLNYLHIKRQFYVSDNVEQITYIDYELTKYQYHELCYDKIPFVYKYGVSDDEKQFERDLLINKFKNYDVHISDQKVELQQYFSDVSNASNSSSVKFTQSFYNQEFLKETALFEKLYSKDSFLRPSFTCFYDYDILLSNNNKALSNEAEQHIFQNKFYGHFIHCIDESLTIKLISPKFHSYFEEKDNLDNLDSDSNVFSNKIQKNIPLFNDEIMKNHKNYCKITVQNVVLQPGDLLYIPSLWFYSYKPDSEYNVSISYNYMTYMNYVLFLQKIYNNVVSNLQNSVQKLLK